MNSDFYEQVQLILTKRRTQAIRENEDRIMEINHKIPQIREINNQLNNTGRELIKIISGYTKN